MLTRHYKIDLKLNSIFEQKLQPMFLKKTLFGNQNLRWNKIQKMKSQRSIFQLSSSSGTKLSKYPDRVTGPRFNVGLVSWLLQSQKLSSVFPLILMSKAMFLQSKSSLAICPSYPRTSIQTLISSLPMFTALVMCSTCLSQRSYCVEPKLVTIRAQKVNRDDMVNVGRLRLWEQKSLLVWKLINGKGYSLRDRL